ncbi:MAG: plastocyanin/azurin family copper-binding protein [Nanoarchaeota archaeon]
MKTNQYLIGLALMAMLALSACTNNTAKTDDKTMADDPGNGDLIPDSIIDANANPPDTAIGEGTTAPEPTVTFSLTGENYKFMMDGKEAPELHVKAGDVVRIEFSSTDGFHDWVLDEFNAKTERVQTGGSSSVQFTAETFGTYEYYCSVGQHRANGMVGNLIVE